MGWAVDHICWNIIRDKILKGRYAGVLYDSLDSNSAIVIRHRDILTGKEMMKIAKLFPKNIRVEFQEITFEGEMSIVTGSHPVHQDNVICPNCEKIMFFYSTLLDPNGVSAVYKCSNCNSQIPMRVSN